jgi:hypothetical protein
MSKAADHAEGTNLTMEMVSSPNDAFIHSR